jgi:hypothetical protein
MEVVYLYIQTGMKNKELQQPKVEEKSENRSSKYETNSNDKIQNVQNKKISRAVLGTPYGETLVPKAQERRGLIFRQDEQDIFTTKARIPGGQGTTKKIFLTLKTQESQRTLTRKKV